ncbi:MAG TPA: hypothetical protein VHA55_00795 [Pseudorhodoplanes sp.]|jgi:hypothetical protein|nr:hypothetical protein [Pseudorhodoplanes sp.]
MTAAADTVPSSGATRIGLIVIAAIESFGALSNFGAVFNAFEDGSPLLSLARIMTDVNLTLAVPLTLVALYFAAAGRLAHAIAALAARMLVTWIADLPSVAIHGLEWSLSYGGITVNGYRFLAPLVALTALWLARRNERLGVATLLVALPSVFTWLGVLIFAIGVMIYGF